MDAQGIETKSKLVQGLMKEKIADKGPLTEKDQIRFDRASAMMNASDAKARLRAIEIFKDLYGEYVEKAKPTIRAAGAQVPGEPLRPTVATKEAFNALHLEPNLLLPMVVCGGKNELVGRRQRADRRNDSQVVGR